MFARVVIAEIDEPNRERIISFVNKQAGDSKQRPGLSDFLVLFNEESRKLITISLWESRKDMDAVAQGASTGIHDEGASDVVLHNLRLEKYQLITRA